MALSEHPLYPRFPDSCVPESAHAFEWKNQRSTDENSDVRFVRQSRPYWYSNLSGVECNERQKDQILAISWRQRGDGSPVLMRVSPFCEIGTIIGYDVNTPIVEPEYLGTGNGTTRTYQIRKRLLVPGYESEFQYYDVTKPYIDYPQSYGVGETAFGPILYDPMPVLQVVYGPYREVLPRNLWTVNRDTGKITSNYNADLYVMGGFYIPMLMPPAIEFTPKGGYWLIKNNVRLDEPRGGK